MLREKEEELPDANSSPWGVEADAAQIKKDEAMAADRLIQARLTRKVSQAMGAASEAGSSFLSPRTQLKKSVSVFGIGTTSKAINKNKTVVSATAIRVTPGSAGGGVISGVKDESTPSSSEILALPSQILQITSNDDNDSLVGSDDVRIESNDGSDGEHGEEDIKNTKTAAGLSPVDIQARVHIHKSKSSSRETPQQSQRGTNTVPADSHGADSKFNSLQSKSKKITIAPDVAEVRNGTSGLSKGDKLKPRTSKTSVGGANVSELEVKNATMDDKPGTKPELKASKSKVMLGRHKSKTNSDAVNAMGTRGKSRKITFGEKLRMALHRGVAPDDEKHINESENIEMEDAVDEEFDGDEDGDDNFASLRNAEKAADIGAESVVKSLAADDYISYQTKGKPDKGTWRKHKTAKS
jgi:hypothetical protein